MFLNLTEHWDRRGSLFSSSRHTATCLSYTANIIAAADTATSGAMSTTATVFGPFAQNIPVAAPGGLDMIMYLYTHTKSLLLRESMPE